MRRSKRAKACEISHKTKVTLWERDGGCIFCQMGYYPPAEPQVMFDAMHYIPRSKGGLGIPQNAAIGCRWHHEMMDNGNKGRRAEMLTYFRWYLAGKYEDWREGDLVYAKYQQSPERHGKQA